jgi:hypothetical protein
MLYATRLEQMQSIYLQTKTKIKGERIIPSIHPSNGPTAHIGPWRPHMRFRNSSFLWCGVVSPTPNPQLGGPGLRIYDPRRHQYIKIILVKQQDLANHSGRAV